MKSPEFFKAKADKRENLKESLPLDLRLEGTLKSTKWSFPTRLYPRRNTESPSDKLFFDKLDSYNRNTDNTELTESFEAVLQTL